MVSRKTVFIIGALTCLALGSLLIGDIPLSRLYGYFEEHRILGAVSMGLLMCIATVVAPLTVLPMVPMVAPILGPFTTGLASYIGWSVGSILSFWIARKYGQSITARFADSEAVKRVSVYIQPDTGFLLIVALRMTVPADVLSYALGLFTTVSYRVYVPATLSGLIWYSFAFAYLGESIYSLDYVLFSGISVASVALIYIMWSYVKRRNDDQ
jgi:uncharacterized membrane protein YdjX (TVP38/TMEM64 family)